MLILGPIIWDLREPVENFHGRNDVIEEIQEKLNNASAVVVSALGGCGKTQTVAKFVQLHKEEYHSVIWLVAPNIQTSLQEIVGILTSTENQPNLSVLQASQRISELTRNSKVLIVVDDVFEEHLKNLTTLIRNISSSKFLIATQLSDISGIAPNIKTIDFPKFTDEESKQFLRRNTRQAPEEAIEKLSSELKAFPLCLQQAVSYINKHNIQIPTYITSFRDCKKQILDPKKKYSEYDKTLMTVWSVAFEITPQKFLQ